MHDPKVVAHEIRRPWPQRTSLPRLAGRDCHWPSMITIWHNEPGGRDALTECSRRYQDRDGNWHYTKGWKWHVHHWSVQVHPLQHLRRSLLTRCAWCGGRSRKGDWVNHSLSWDGPRGHWWQGEPGLYHADCSGLKADYSACACKDPELSSAVGGDAYGKCGRCGHFRAWRMSPEQVERAVEAHSRPYGFRPAKA